MIPYQHRPWAVADLAALMEAKVKESRFLDYKRDLPSNKDSDIRDLLADVSAFANYEDEGEPTACPGIGNIDTDEAIRRLSNIIENSLDPPLRGFNFDLIQTQDETLVLALRVKQSPSAPHMLTKGSPKFYSRGAAGNVPMGSYDIRAAFLASEGMSDKVRRFVRDRCELIVDGGIDFDLSERGQAILHIIPIEAFSRPRNLSMTELESVIEQFAPAVTSGGWGHSYCLDGIATASSPGSEKKTNSYSLLFRNGCIEATCPCRHNTYFQEGKVADKFTSAAPKYEALLRRLGFTSPFFVSLTVIGCKDSFVYVDPGIGYFGLDIRPINTDFLLLPILEWVEDPVDWVRALRHFCDLCSNAMGFPSSLAFRSDGTLRQ